MALTMFADFKWGLMELMQNDNHKAKSALAKADNKRPKTFWLCSAKQQTHRSFGQNSLTFWKKHLYLTVLCSNYTLVLSGSCCDERKKKQISNLLYHIDDGCCCWFKYHSCILWTNPETPIHFPVLFIMHLVSETLYINIKHQMTTPSYFYNQSLQDNILCLVCGADASLCSDHLIHNAVSGKKKQVWVSV